MASNIAAFKQLKANGERISMLTAYDYPTAQLLERASVDSILVGDSLGNVILGYKNTIPVTVEDMVHHGAAVKRGAPNTLVLVDMPFMSYQSSTRDALLNAGRIMKETGCDAVKLEGGVAMAPTIKALANAGIPVCAHVGMMPQSVNAYGGFKVQGKSEDDARKLLEDALAVEQAGAFAVVLECVPAPLAGLATKQLGIPTIGIGAGVDCDGQVLVTQDMLGMFDDFAPKFVKRFASIGQQMQKAFQEYNAQVKDGSFPTQEQAFSMDSGTIEQIEQEFCAKSGSQE